MRPTVETVLGWHPAALESAGDALAGGRSRLVALADDLHTARRAHSWVGEAADAAGRRVEHLRRRLADVVAEISAVTTAVDRDAPTLRGLHEELESLRRLTISPLLARLAGVDARTEDVLTRATACDARLEAALQRARSDLVDAGGASLRDAALPAHLRGATDDALVAWVLAEPDEATAYLSALPVAVRQRLGEELADRLDAGQPDDDLALLEDLGEDEVVATSTLEALGPGGLLGLATALVPRARVVSAPTDDRGAPMRRALGRMLAAGASDTEAAGARRVSGAYLDRLARDVGSQQRDDGFRTPRMGLAPVVRHAAGSTTVLTTVGAAILDADRAEHETPEWERLRQQPPDVLGFDRLAALSAADPVAEVLAGAAENPEAARQLLGDTATLRHLLVERPWPDHVRGADIRALGGALEAATTVAPDARSVAVAGEMVDALRERFDRDPGADDLMDPRLRPHVGAVLGEYLPSLHELLGGPEPGHPASGVPDAGPRGDLAPAGSPEEARQSVSLLLADVGKDAGAGQLLVAQANGHTAELLVHTLRGVPPEQLPTAVDLAMTNVVGPHADLVGAVDHGLAAEVRTEQTAQDRDATQDNRRRVVAGASVAKLLVSQIPVAGDALGTGIDLARSELLAAAEVDRTGATNREVGMLFSAGEEDQRVLVRALVAELLPPDLPDEVRYQVELAAENQGGSAYLAGRLEAEKRINDFE